MMIVSFALLMVGIEKRGSSLVDLHNVCVVSSSNILYLDLPHDKLYVSHVPSCSFLGENYLFLSDIH